MVDEKMVHLYPKAINLIGEREIGKNLKTVMSLQKDSKVD